MVFSIEESLHLFQLIKKFHERGLTTNPRFKKLQFGIVNSLFNMQTCLKPEWALSQNGFNRPVNFAAWSNVVKFIQNQWPEVVMGHYTFPSAEVIIGIFLDDGNTNDYGYYYESDLIYDFDPINKAILKGLISGAGIAIPPDEDVSIRISFSRSQLLRASYAMLSELVNVRHRLQKLIMLLRLIIANHFEKIPNDVHHLIALKGNFLSGNVPSLYRVYYAFLCPRISDTSND